MGGVKLFYPNKIGCTFDTAYLAFFTFSISFGDIALYPYPSLMPYTKNLRITSSYTYDPLISKPPEAIPSINPFGFS